MKIYSISENKENKGKTVKHANAVLTATVEVSFTQPDNHPETQKAIKEQMEMDLMDFYEAEAVHQVFKNNILKENPNAFNEDSLPDPATDAPTDSEPPKFQKYLKCTAIITNGPPSQQQYPLVVTTFSALSLELTTPNRPFVQNKTQELKAAISDVIEDVKRQYEDAGIRGGYNISITSMLMGQQIDKQMIPSIETVKSPTDAPTIMPNTTQNQQTPIQPLKPTT